MLESGDESHLSCAPNKYRGAIIFPERNRPAAANRRIILRGWQVWRPYNALETRLVAVPRCTLVTGQIDLSTGGEGGKTPMRKLKPELTGACPSRERRRNETKK
jgi:hypothetical protein